ncbi:MAG: hypothetical protein ABSA11_10580 [Candidatus Bathyarchaeia archaeon]
MPYRDTVRKANITLSRLWYACDYTEATEVIHPDRSVASASQWDEYEHHIEDGAKSAMQTLIRGAYRGDENKAAKKKPQKTWV